MVKRIAIMVFWKYTGFNIVALHHGFNDDSKRRILEAARMDGANAFRRFWNISANDSSIHLLCYHDDHHR